MKASLKNLLSGALWYTGVTGLARRLWPQKDVTVLMYHKVEKEAFEQQVAYLKKHYNIISEQELYDYYYKKKALPKNSVLITFDDGYLNNYEVAYPILKRHGAPAIIFLTTGFIGKDKMPWYDLVAYLIEHTRKERLSLDGESFIMDRKGRRRLLTKYYHYMITADEEEFSRLLSGLQRDSGVRVPKVPPHDLRFMTWEQAKEMMPLVSFGAHTVSHPVITNISRERLKGELVGSKEEVERRLGTRCISFCYPNGDYDAGSVEAVRKAGFKLSFSSLFGRNTRADDPFRIKRFGVNVSDNRNVLAFKLSRLSNLFKRWKRSSHFRVVMLTNYYYPQLGGITTVVHQLHTYLSRHNVKSFVLPYPHLFRRIERLFSNSLFLHRLLVVVYACYVQVVLLFMRLVHRKVIVHSHSANFCARAASFSRLFGTRTVHTFHTHLGMSPHKPRPARYFDHLDVLTSVSRVLGEDTRRAYGISKPVMTVFNGVDEQRKRKSSFYRRGDTIKLLFIGHLFSIKDPFLFVHSVERLLAEGERVEAVMIGDGDLYGELESYLKDHSLSMIRLLGSVPHAEVERYYRWADVFVSTSKGEGLGVVLLEAMAMGTPVVATDSDGSREVIEHLKNGYLVTGRDATDITAGVHYALRHASSLSKQGLSTIADKFSWERLVREYLKLYRRLSLERGVENSEE